MIQFLRQKRATILFAGLISLMVVLMSHDVGNRGGTDIAADIIFKAGAPAVRAGSSMTSFVGDMFQNYVDLRAARAESQKLREQLLRAERERDALREMAAAGGRLQGLLGLKQQIAAGGTTARIAGSGIASGRASLLIDRGSSDGVLPNMPVVALGGVVGKVVLCSPSLAKVQCVGDPASGVAVVLESSGYQGMVVGRSVGVCDLIYVPPYAEVGHGDLLVTSGLDRIYPRGIPVGRVVGLPQGAGVSRRFEVKPCVDFQRLAEVLVLPAWVRPGPGEEPR